MCDVMVGCVVYEGNTFFIKNARLLNLCQLFEEKTTVKKKRQGNDLNFVIKKLMLWEITHDKANYSY